MLFSFGPCSNKRRCRWLAVTIVCLGLYIATLIAAKVLRFATDIHAHTVSELDLSSDYQKALNVSLQTNPCCDAAKWTPAPKEILEEQIPRIIHQTYKTSEIPEGDWQTAHQLCLNIHPPTENWHHILWTDESAQEFIAAEYPEFLPIFQAYPYPIQRVDAMRYFILYHYGGIYIDLDIGCARSMLSLLRFPAFFPKTQPLGVSNDLIGSRPGHTFMYRLIQALYKQGARKRFGTMYLTVFFTTGPMFVNRILSKYFHASTENVDRVVILPANFYSESLTAYFMHFPGSSWHGNDASGAILLYTYGWIVIVGLVLGYLVVYMKGRFHKRSDSNKFPKPMDDV